MIHYPSLCCTLYLYFPKRPIICLTVKAHTGSDAQLCTWWSGQTLAMLATRVFILKEMPSSSAFKQVQSLQPWEDSTLWFLDDDENKELYMLTIVHWIIKKKRDEVGAWNKTDKGKVWWMSSYARAGRQWWKIHTNFSLFPTQFNKTLSLSEQDIKARHTNYRKSITTKEWLAVTPR